MAEPLGIATTPEERALIREAALRRKRQARNERSARTTDGITRTPIGPKSREQGRARYLAHSYHGAHPFMLDMKRLARRPGTPRWYPSEKQARVILQLCGHSLPARNDAGPSTTC
jgi:hypothetical protein